MSGPMVIALFGLEALADDAHMKVGMLSSFKRFSLAWNCISEIDVDAALALAEKLSGRIVKKPEKVFWGGYSGYFADPEDNLWEVAHNPFFPFDTHGGLVLP